ncbi:hypothetical protein ACFX13_024375 [Malus domestica]
MPAPCPREVDRQPPLLAVAPPHLGHNCQRKAQRIPSLRESPPLKETEEEADKAQQPKRRTRLVRECLLVVQISEKGQTQERAFVDLNQIEKVSKEASVSSSPTKWSMQSKHRLAGQRIPLWFGAVSSPHSPVVTREVSQVRKYSPIK